MSSSTAAATPYTRYLSQVLTTLTTGIHTQSFKAGAFKPLIHPCSTSWEASLNALICSALNTPEEKLRCMHVKYYLQLEDFVGSEVMIMAGDGLDALIQMFASDEEARAAGSSTTPCLPHRAPMPTFTSTSSPDFFTHMHRQLLHKIKLYSYKNGAFKDSITSKLSTEKILNKLLGSPLTTNDEKKIIREAREKLTTLHKIFSGAAMPESRHCKSTYEAFELLFDQFIYDEEPRAPYGRYSPPIVLQTFNNDGSIKETHRVRRDGSATITQGGIWKVAPDAPEWFKQARMALTEREGGPALKGVRVKVDHFDEGEEGEGRVITERIVDRYVEDDDEDE